MRKIYPILFAFAMVATATVANAQCTPNPAYTNPGIYPTPADGIPAGEISLAYSQVLTVNVPNDTTIDLSSLIGFPTPPVTVTINYQRIDNFNGLPAGLTYACNVGPCQWNGGQTGCLEVSGTPTTTGQYVANLSGVLNITVPQAVPIIGGTQQDLPTPLAYNFDITNSTSIEPGTESGLVVEQNVPNPFAGSTTIRFYSPVVADFDFRLTDLNGRIVTKKALGSLSGSQRIELNAAHYSPGVYFFSLSNGTDRVTRKLIVAR